MDFTQEELKNLMVMINKCPITGQEAMTVALLQQKIAKLITPEPAKEEKKK